MRIGIDARFYSPAATGIGRYTHELIRHILRIDRENHYWIFLNSPQFEAFLPPRSGVTKVLGDCPHYSFSEQWKFWKIIRAYDLDLMHFTHFNAPVLYRRPSIVTIHDLTLSFHPGKKMNVWWRKAAYHFILRSITRRAKKIIAVSEHTKRDILNFLHLDPDKIAVIHEGVSEQFRPIADSAMIEDFLASLGLSKPYILYTGVWRSHKNLVNLIKAFGILKCKYNFAGSLVITGKEDPWYPEVKRTVKEERLEGTVRFTGFIPDEDMPLLYNGAILYVMPSFYEGFGLPILEAFACGVPVCAARSSSLPEVCGEGNAVFFNPYDLHDIAEKIESVYNNPQKMEELKKRGLERAKQFSWEKMARETLEIYKKSVI